MCVRVLFIMCTYVAMCRCVQVPTEARTGHWILWSWSKRQLWVAVYGCRELNSGSCTLKEQYKFLMALQYPSPFKLPFLLTLASSYILWEGYCHHYPSIFYSWNQESCALGLAPGSLNIKTLWWYLTEDGRVPAKSIFLLFEISCFMKSLPDTIGQ